MTQGKILENQDEILSFERLFKPNNASTKIAFFIEGFLRQGYNIENLYIVSPKEDELSGIKCYKSIDDVPIDKFDLLILSVRRALLVSSVLEILSKNVLTNNFSSRS